MGFGSTDPGNQYLKSNPVSSWEIHGLMLFSLLIQLLLTYFAPHRKHRSDMRFYAYVWVLYWGADLLAAYNIRFITWGKGDASLNPGLLSFWLPFLLSRLGGSDTITAMSLEDNESWFRPSLALALQAIFTLQYILGQFISAKISNPMWLSTLLVLFTGCMKCVVRVLALYSASSDTFRENTRLDAAEQLQSNHQPLTRQEIDAVLEPIAWVHVEETEDLVNEAFRNYTRFKPLLVGGSLTIQKRDASRASFIRNLPPRGLKLIEIELNLIHDSFYTKAIMFQKRILPLALRSCWLACFTSMLFSLVWFAITDKSSYNKIDVGVTYMLLVGAIFLDDVFAVYCLFVSDWWTVLFPPNRDNHNDLITNLRNTLLGMGQPQKRWSRSISQYDFLKRSRQTPSYFTYIRIPLLKNLLIGREYVVQMLDHEQLLLKFIAEVVYRRSTNLDLYSLHSNPFQDHLIYSGFKPHIDLVDFANTLLTWHLATNICYYYDEYLFAQGKISSTQEEEGRRRISKQLSDYISYVILREPAMVSSISGLSDLRVESTLESLTNYIAVKPNLRNDLDTASETEFLMNFSRALLLEQPNDILSNNATSALYKVCMLIQAFTNLNQQHGQRWDKISNAWVGIVIYAAYKSTPRAHVQELTKGGELLTHVWLLMVHLGLGEQVQDQNLQGANNNQGEEF